MAVMCNFPNGNVKHRTDTTANWGSKNPILLDGEIGIEVCTDGSKKIKVGNGSTAWNGLKYIEAEMIPKSHADTSNTYGLADGSKYGHVKLSSAVNLDSNVSGGMAATPSAVKAVYDLANGKAAKSSYAVVSVYPDKWVGNAAPYTATVECNIVTSSNNIVVGVASNATALQLAAARKALIQCTSQENGKIILTARGVIPDRYVPIVIMVMG